MLHVVHFSSGFESTSIYFYYVRFSRWPDQLPGRGVVTEGGWKMAEGDWKMAEGGWKMTEGDWKVHVRFLLEIFGEGPLVVRSS